MSGYFFKQFDTNVPGYTKDVQTIQQRIEKCRMVETPKLRESYSLQFQTAFHLNTSREKFFNFFRFTSLLKQDGKEPMSVAGKGMAAISGELLVSTIPQGEIGARRIVQNGEAESMDEIIGIEESSISYIGFHFDQQASQILDHILASVSVTEKEAGIDVVWTYKVGTKGIMGWFLGRIVLLPTLKSFHQANVEHWKRIFC